MSKLTKTDFLDHYEKVKPLHLEFQSDRVIISNINDWKINREIQEYVARSENCYFIELKYKSMEIKID